MGGGKGLTNARVFYDLLQSVKATEKEMHAQRELLTTLGQAVHDMRRGMQTREDWHREYRLDTNTLPTDRIGRPIEIFSDAGAPANSLSVIAVGGGNLEVLLDEASDWIPVNAGDKFNNENISSCWVHVTANAVGTARLRFGAFVGRGVA